MTIMAIVMYERYRTYKKLYSKYRNMRPGTRELSSEVCLYVCVCVCMCV